MTHASIRVALRHARTVPSDWIERVSMREREVRNALWLMVAVVWVLAPFPRTLPIWCSLLTATLLIWRTHLTWNGHRPPARVILLGLMLAATVVVYLQYRTIFGKDAGVSLVILLLGLKLLELNARRDLLVVVFLCLFVMLTNLFESQGIATALWLMIGVVLLVTAMLRANFLGREPPFWKTLGLAAQMSAMALPLMAVMFLFFPRIEGPLWGMPTDAFAHHMGLSDSMSPGSLEHLVQSDATAFEAEFLARVPGPAQRYWRGPVFDSFDGRTWRASTAERATKAPEFDATAMSLVEYTVTQEPSDRRELYLLDAPAAAPKLARTKVSLRADLSVTTKDPVLQRVRFHAVSYTHYRYGLSESAIQLRQWLELPPGYDPRTIEFARNLLTQSKDPRTLIARVLSYFRTQKFYYTPNPPALGRNSVDEFLFQTRRGFCEHYASAFVFLMRALAIPARVVTGYQGGTFDPENHYLTVRQRDAHAWAEVWLKAQGWVRVDPTAAVAPERIEQGAEEVLGLDSGFGSLFGHRASGWMTSLRQHAEALDTAWNRWIIAYTADAQSRLLSGLGIPSLDWQALTIALIVAAAVILAAVAVKTLGQRPRRDPIERIYARFCARLHKLGPARQACEGPDSYRVRILPLVPEPHRARVARAFALYEVLRFARPSPDSLHHQKEFRACVSTLRV